MSGQAMRLVHALSLPVLAAACMLVLGFWLLSTGNLQASGEDGGSINAGGMTDPVKVMIRLEDGRPSGMTTLLARPTIQSLQASLLSAPPVDIEVRSELKSIPAVLAEVDRDEIEALRDDPRVRAVFEIPEYQLFGIPLDAEAATLMRHEYLGLAGLGLDGTGITVAVLDTGIRNDHVAFADSNLVEKCLSPDRPNASLPPTCDYGIGEGAGLAAPDGEEHGTHVTGIIASIAPKANLIFYEIGQPGNLNLDGFAIAESFDDLVVNQPDVDVVSLSFGAPLFQNTYCNWWGDSEFLDVLAARGVTVVVASGNDGDPEGIAAPACLESVISVASVDDESGEVSDFSNSADILDLFAPGYRILSADIHGDDDALVNMAGTSMATPMAAGLAALLRQQGYDAQETEARLKRGPLVTDARINANNRQTPRIDFQSAFQDADIAAATVTAVGGDVLADGVAEVTITVVLQDEYGIEMDGLRASQIEVTLLTGDHESATAASSAVAETGTPGTYEFTATNTTVEVITVAVTVHGATLEDTAEVAFVAGAPEDTSSVTASPAVGVPANGVTASTVTVAPVDALGNPVAGLEAEDFDIEIHAGPDESLTAVPSEIAETGTPGTYEFEVTNTTAETVTVSVAILGVPSSFTPTIEFVAPTLSASESSVTAAPAAGVTANGVATSTVTVTLRDQGGVPFDGVTAEDIEVGITGSNVDTAVLDAVTDSGAGTFTFTVTNTAAGTVTLTITADGTPLDDEPTIAFVAPSTGGSNPSPPIRPTSTEAGGVTVIVQGVASDVATGTEPVSLETTLADGTSAAVSVPSGAFPPGTRVSVGTIANMEELLEQAPPPTATASMVVAFQMLATTGSGDAITGDFGEPVELAFTVPAGSLPAGAPGSELTVVFWNGSAWVEVPTTATVNPDGSVTLTSTVGHFTIFAVAHVPGLRAFATPLAASGVTITSWGGGTVAEAAAVEGVRSLWVWSGGRHHSYIAGAPAFVNEGFLGLFPSGLLPRGTLVVVVTG